MQEMLANLNADFLFPKVHGMWARSLFGEDLRTLVHSHRIEALQRALSPRGLDVSQRASFQKELTRRFITEIGAVRRLLDPHGAAFYRAFIDRYFFENLKTALHVHFFPERGQNVEFLLIEGAHLPAIDAEKLTEARTVNELYRQIPKHPVREALPPILRELEKNRDIPQAECHLDRMYYERFLDAARRLPTAAREIGLKLVSTEIDVTNIVMIMRTIEFYDLDADMVAALCSEGGRLVQAASVAELARLPSRQALVEALPRSYRVLLEPLVDAELHVSENALWNAQFRIADSAFKDYDQPALSVVAFPFLKRAEMLNISRVFEGVHFGLSPAEIEEMMIGMPYA